MVNCKQLYALQSAPHVHARHPVAELKAKAEKAKDAGVTKATNTRDRFISTPSSKVNWDPNWKRAPPPPATSSPSGRPPPPVRSRLDDSASGSGATPPVVPRTLRPTELDDVPAAPPYIPRPPPTRAVSGYPTAHQDTSQDAVTKIDWANLSAEDKEEFFGWLDEFFSRYLGIELGPRERRSAPGVHRVQNAKLPVSMSWSVQVQGRHAS